MLDIEIDNLSLYATKLVFSILILIVGIVLSNLISRVIKESFIRGKIDVTIGKFIRKTIKFLLYFFVIITALSTLGLNIQPIIAGLGIAGFIIGFAVKGTLSNFAAGVLLLFYRPFEVGNEISASKVRGIVKEINIIATILETNDGDIITVPNSKVWGAPIIKHSKNSSL